MIIIIQGPPASGKSTLATKVSERFNIPHISRDNIQEWLYEAHSKSFLEISDKVYAEFGYTLAFDFARELNKGSGSFILEGCFNPENAHLIMQDILSETKHEIVEVFLDSNVDDLIDRYVTRSKNGQRHEAYGEEFRRSNELKIHLESVKYKPMNIGDKVFNYKTDNSNFNFDDFFQYISPRLVKS